MSTLLTPIITQLEIDRDRFKVLINGGEFDTVQLEDRVEKSIAGQVADRINALAVDLTAAVNNAEQFADAAQNSATSASASESAVQAAVGVAQAAAGTAQTAADSASQDAQETESAKNTTLIAISEFTIDKEYLPRYETSSLPVDATDQLIDVQSSAVWRVDGTQNWNLVFPDAADFAYDEDRSQSVIVFIEGSGGTITWPVEVSWAGGNEPELGTTWTNVVLFWTGTMWIGMESAKR